MCPSKNMTIALDESLIAKEVKEKIEAACPLFKLVPSKRQNALFDIVHRQNKNRYSFWISLIDDVPWMIDGAYPDDNAADPTLSILISTIIANCD